MEPTRAPMFADEYVSRLSLGLSHAMVLVTRYPPGAEHGKKDDEVEVEEEQIEAIVKTTQEACFWASKFGYPVIIAPSEQIYRKWEGGERGTHIDADIRRCFTELQLRAEFHNLFITEELRLRTAVTKAPRLMLAKMESEEMELTSDQMKARDVETQKAQHELEEKREVEMEKAKKRQQLMQDVQARLAASSQ